MLGLRLFSTLAVLLPLAAQPPAVSLAPSLQPDTQALAGALRGLRRTTAASAENRAAAERLQTEAQAELAAGRAGEARRRLAQAYALLQGRDWNAGEEFAWSLALRPDRIVADPALPFIARLTQVYPAPNAATNLRAALLRDGKPVRELGESPVTSRDLIAQPAAFDASLTGLADGAYTLRVELAGSAAVEAPVQIVAGIATERAAIEKRLARISGHEGAKGTVRYPYVLAETVNVGRRQLSPADFGIPFQPQLPYDFAAGVRSSAELLKALEAGKDPLYRAKGDSQRHYWLEDAKEMMAYHVYAPVKWDGKSKLPMVLVLHGNTRDQDYYFDRDEHILAKTAEKHGYLVVCPMGYRPSAGWGSYSAGRRPADPVRVRQSELSEKDALQVLERIQQEYPIDSSRVYLFGHSAGGAGTWHMGQKYAGKWAALAASAAATPAEGFPFERLKSTPLMVCHGGKDDEVPVSRSRNMVSAAKAQGLEPLYVEIPDATHGTIVALVIPKVFAFFEQQSLKK